MPDKTKYYREKPKGRTERGEVGTRQLGLSGKTTLGGGDL